MKYLTVQVRGENNAVVRFEISARTPIRKVMEVYCNRLGLARYEATFDYNGRAIKIDDTAKALDMKDLDYIDVYTRHLPGDIWSRDDPDYF